MIKEKYGRLQFHRGHETVHSLGHRADPRDVGDANISGINLRKGGNGGKATATGTQTPHDSRKYRNAMKCHPGTRPDDRGAGDHPNDDLPTLHLSTIIAHWDRGQSGYAANRKRMTREIKELMYRRAYEFVRRLHIGKQKEVDVP